MKQSLLLLLTPGILALLDGLWLGVVAKRWYAEHLGHLFSEQVRWVPVIIFYILYSIGLCVFVILPMQSKPLITGILIAALFGLVCYGTYDLVNAATLRNWPHIVTLVDMLYGAIATTITATVVILLIRG